MGPPMYRIELCCPRCNRAYETHSEKRNPRVQCGDCLMEDVEIVEMTVVNVEEIHAPNGEANG